MRNNNRLRVKIIDALEFTITIIVKNKQTFPDLYQAIFNIKQNQIF